MTEPVNANGRPRLPLWIAVVSIVIAIASVSVLVLVLYEETKGPGEILREFARRVDRHDCEGSYDLLDDEVQASLPASTWCEQQLAAVDEGLDSDFDLEQAILEGDTAEVTVSGVDQTEWELRRFGERSWRVVGPLEGFTYTDIETIP
jgi:hypothetical protein